MTKKVHVLKSQVVHVTTASLVYLVCIPIIQYDLVAHTCDEKKSAKRQTIPYKYKTENETHMSCLKHTLERKEGIHRCRYNDFQHVQNKSTLHVHISWGGLSSFHFLSVSTKYAKRKVKNHSCLSCLPFTLSHYILFFFCVLFPSLKNLSLPLSLSLTLLSLSPHLPCLVLICFLLILS